MGAHSAASVSQRFDRPLPSGSPISGYRHFSFRALLTPGRVLHDRQSSVRRSRARGSSADPPNPRLPTPMTLKRRKAEGQWFESTRWRKCCRRTVRRLRAPTSCHRRMDPRPARCGERNCWYPYWQCRGGFPSRLGTEGPGAPWEPGRTWLPGRTRACGRTESLTIYLGGKHFMDYVSSFFALFVVGEYFPGGCNQWTADSAGERTRAKIPGAPPRCAIQCADAARMESAGQAACRMRDRNCRSSFRSRRKPR
jgi:hypothetical protein